MKRRRFLLNTIGAFFGVRSASKVAGDVAKSATPTAKAGFQYGSLLSDLKESDPQIYPELLKKYGNENYAMVWQMLCKTPES